MAEGTQLRMSIVPYTDGRFEIIFKSGPEEEELSFCGMQELSNEQLKLAHKIAPPCVYTSYLRVDSRRLKLLKQQNIKAITIPYSEYQSLIDAKKELDYLMKDPDTCMIIADGHMKGEIDDS